MKSIKLTDKQVEQLQRMMFSKKYDQKTVWRVLKIIGIVK